MTDVKQGRSSRPKPNPVSPRELKARTPSQLAAYMSPDAKQAARQARIADLAAQIPACAWCGEPVLRHVRPHEHDACQKALGASVAPAAVKPAVVVPTPVLEAPGPSRRETVVDPGESSPARRTSKPAVELVDGDVVLDGELWRTVLFFETDEGIVRAETTRFDGEEWVTLTWPADEMVTWRRA